MDSLEPLQEQLQSWQLWRQKDCSSLQQPGLGAAAVPQKDCYLQLELPLYYRKMELLEAVAYHQLNPMRSHPSMKTDQEQLVLGREFAAVVAVEA